MPINATEPLPIPDWMIVDSSRYACGRLTYQVGETVSWLIAHWEKIPENARRVIAIDLKDAFSRDDLARERGLAYLPLGMDVDREQWEKILALCVRDGLAPVTTFLFPGGG